MAVQHNTTRGQRHGQWHGQRLGQRLGHSYGRRPVRAVLFGGAMLALAGCATSPFDVDFRNLVGGGLNLSGRSQERLSANRPEPDARGIISYPSYQVAVARRGDSLATLAQRIGMAPAELARFNGLPVDAPLREGEVIVLPGRVAEPPNGPIAITSLAGAALDRAENAGAGSSAANTQASLSRTEPARHRVQRGETAYSIARAYNVSVRALADWNGLGPSMTVREGQFLLIPPTASVATGPDTAAPGQGSRTPVPPSASRPLPNAPEVVATPITPDLSGQATQASAARMVMPVDGRIIRAYQRGKTDGIDIAAAAGSPVRAAAAGTVAAITRDTENVPILVIRHPGNLLTVYANIDNITVAKGDRVSKGQKIAEVRAGNPAFLHFQVREGTQSVDPEGYLN